MCKVLLGLEYDKDGVIAASGKVDASLMDHFMKHPFWDRPVPRSGWSQDYSEEYIKATIQKFSFLPKEDLLATACAFTGEAVARSMKENVPEDIIKSTDKLYASGGGVKNPQIMKEIQKRVPGNIKVTTSAEIGIPPEYKEAIKFATIADRKSVV